MRLLLDECVPRKFRNMLPGHDCRTAPEEGLAGRKNGELLSLAEKSDFEVFLTLDRGLEYEQNLQGRNIAVILIRSKSSSIRPGDLIKVG
jgi:predicted nuclease of predicted toxin-antitoxin system